MHTHCTVHPHTAAPHCCCSNCIHICQLNSTPLLAIADTAAAAAAAGTVEGVHRTPLAGRRTAAAEADTAAGAAAAVRCTAEAVART
jgi:hypothetical protein